MNDDNLSSGSLGTESFQNQPQAPQNQSIPPQNQSIPPQSQPAPPQSQPSTVSLSTQPETIQLAETPMAQPIETPMTQPTETPTAQPIEAPVLQPNTRLTAPESDPMPAIPSSAIKKSNNHKTMIILAAVTALLLLAAAVVMIMTLGANNQKSSNTSQNNSEQSTQQSADFVESYDLSALTSDLNISEPGTYELYGSGSHSVIVNANDEVTLYLNNATISATQTAAIANISPNSLTIEIADNTTNTLSDGGASDYDGCIYSTGKLTIDGNDGILNVNGQQEDGEGITTKSNDMTINGGKITIKSSDDGLNAGGDGGTITINGGTIDITAGGDGIDSNKTVVINGGDVRVAGSSAGGDAGIDTDSGYTINGGNIIALGSDMLEAPSDSSRQNVLAIMLDKSYTTGSKVVLAKSDGDEIIAFVANENFRTLVLSSSNISYGTYQLKINDETVVDNLAVIKSVTSFGNLDQQPSEPSKNDEPQSGQPAAQESTQPTDSSASQSSTGDTYGRIPINQIPTNSEQGI